jgi:phage terminase large subunit
MTHKPRIFLSYNPVECWINELHTQKNVKRVTKLDGDDYRFEIEFEVNGIKRIETYRIIHSTIDDNPFANEEYRMILEGMKVQNKEYYNIYRLGIVGQREHVIYQPHEIINEFPERYNEVIYGLDFGYNSPTALLQVGEIDLEFYEKELIYQTGLTDDDIIDLMKELIPKELMNSYIYGDCERPESIEQIHRAGFNILPCVKGKGSVIDGIRLCQRFKYYTTPDNINLLNERKGYTFKKDKNDRILEEPLKWKDHLMDARRYAIFTHFKDRLGVPSLLEQIKEDRNDSWLESAQRIL